MSLDYCPSYCGLACVDGSCPAATRDCYVPLNCPECWRYLGCKDCYFAVDDGTCAAFEDRSAYEDYQNQD